MMYFYYLILLRYFAMDGTIFPVYSAVFNKTFNQKGNRLIKHWKRTELNSRDFDNEAAFLKEK